ncbi:hypothetical protein FRC03_000589 [Tulasnella sp. 419]|nr:hypothetical protein FRC03_000589 [Tulasnella sp. 419]
MDTDIFDRVVEVNLNNESDGPTSNEPSQTLLHDTEAVIQSWTQDSQSRNTQSDYLRHGTDIHGFLLEDRRRGHIKLVDEGKASLSRYKSGGSLEEIDRAIRSFEDALPTLKSFEENRWADEAAILFLLAYCYKLKYSDHGGLTTDGHRGITTFQAAMKQSVIQ